MKYIALIAVLIAALALFGCLGQGGPIPTATGQPTFTWPTGIPGLTEQPTATGGATATATATAGATGTAAAGGQSLLGYYNYRVGQRLVYRMTPVDELGDLNESSAMRYTYEITGEETVNGKAAWVQQITMEYEHPPEGMPAGFRSTSKVWIDKATLHCIKTQTIIEVPGMAPITQEAACDPSSASSAAADTSLQYVGPETVTVPAGTFGTAKWTRQDGQSETNVWASADVGSYVKFTSFEPGSGGVQTELVSYS